MVWPWKKTDIIDMTKMKLPPSSISDNVEIVDLSSSENSSVKSTPNTPNMDFLGGLAGVSRSEPEVSPSPGSITDNLREARKSKLKAAFNQINLKIDDHEFKLNDAVSKLRDVKEGLLPELFAKMEKAKKVRKYIPFFTIEFKFRSIPQKVGQHYAFGGRAEMKFTSYALNGQ